MNIYDYFIACETDMPEKRTSLRRTSFVLRRAGVNTMEALCNLQAHTPKELSKVRDIGPQSLNLINEVVILFENRAKACSQVEGKQTHTVKAKVDTITVF